MAAWFHSLTYSLIHLVISFTSTEFYWIFTFIVVWRFVFIRWRRKKIQELKKITLWGFHSWKAQNLNLFIHHSFIHSTDTKNMFYCSHGAGLRTHKWTRTYKVVTFWARRNPDSHWVQPTHISNGEIEAQRGKVLCISGPMYWSLPLSGVKYFFWAVELLDRSSMKASLRMSLTPLGTVSPAETRVWRTGPYNVLLVLWDQDMQGKQSHVLWPNNVCKLMSPGWTCQSRLSPLDLNVGTFDPL